MSRIRRTIDIEGALQAALSDSGWSASAPPWPADLGETLPHVHIVCTGGSRSLFVQDESNVSLHVYAATEAAAMEAACDLTAWVCELPGNPLGGSTCHAAQIVARPYSNPDPRHPDIARATVGIRVRTRTLHQLP